MRLLLLTLLLAAPILSQVKSAAKRTKKAKAFAPQRVQWRQASLSGHIGKWQNQADELVLVIDSNSITDQQIDYQISQTWSYKGIAKVITKSSDNRYYTFYLKLASNQELLLWKSGMFRRIKDARQINRGKFQKYTRQ